MGTENKHQENIQNVLWEKKETTEHKCIKLNESKDDQKIEYFNRITEKKRWKLIKKNNKVAQDL